MMVLTKRAILSALIIAFAEAFSENSVYLKSSDVFMNKLVTSSTLRWISSEKGSHPETAVVGTTEIMKNDESSKTKIAKKPNDESTESYDLIERNVYICRAKHIGYGIWVPGQLKTGREACLISQHDKVESYEKYEVLENVESGARLSWVQWSKFSEVPVGTVSAGETYVARRKITGNSVNLGVTHFIGKLDDNSGFPKLIAINEEGKEQDFTDGEVLVETEPIRYELTNIKFITNNINNKKTVKKQPLTLGFETLENTQNIPGEVESVIGYDVNSSVYWGQGKAMLKGLATIIRSTNSNHLEEIKWGIREDENRQNVYKIEMYLHPGTAVNVTLKGNYTETETPYTSKLIAIYQDGAHRARTIQGIQQEIQMMDIMAEFSDIYFTANFTLVPTTTTTSTTPVPTTLYKGNAVSTNQISNTKDERNKEKSMMNDQGSKPNLISKNNTSQESNRACSNLYGYRYTTILFLVTLWKLYN